MTLEQKTKALWRVAPFIEKAEVTRLGWRHKLYRLTPKDELAPGESPRLQSLLFGCLRRTAVKASIHLQRRWIKIDVTHCSGFVVFRVVAVLMPDGTLSSRSEYEEQQRVAESNQAAAEHERSEG